MLRFVEGFVVEDSVRSTVKEEVRRAFLAFQPGTQIPRESSGELRSPR
jgi:hypothetical protein